METLDVIAALYIEPDGVYSGIAGVDAWCEMRDARCYSGPYPVVAHPPCQRWGRFWHGSTRKPHQFKLGDDGGCFAAALAALESFGGVLEHPCDSHAWKHFGLTPPKRFSGWQPTPWPSLEVENEWRRRWKSKNYRSDAAVIREAKEAGFTERMMRRFGKSGRT